MIPAKTKSIRFESTFVHVAGIDKAKNRLINHFTDESL